MPDIYCYEDMSVLKNKLDIRDEKTLDLVETEQSRSNMMLLYEQGFDDFTPEGLCAIHKDDYIPQPHYQRGEDE